MEVHIKIHGQILSVEVSAEVGEFLDRARHTSENLAHEKRRHWDGREFDEYIVARECSRSYYETPEDGSAGKKLSMRLRQHWKAAQQNSVTAFCFTL